MARIRYPDEIDHPEPRELANFAIWIRKLGSAVDELRYYAEDLNRDCPDDFEQEGGDAIEDAAGILDSAYERYDQELEGRAIEWLAKDPEHWPIFRLVVLDPWRSPTGKWRKDTPGWVRDLSTTTVIAHFQQDPYGRKREFNLFEGESKSA